MSKPNPGRLRDRVTIERNAPAADEYGQEIEGWAALAVRWARVRPAAGDERIVPDTQQQSGRVVVVEMRGRLGVAITTRDRLVYRGRKLAIVDVSDPDGRGLDVDVTCRETDPPEVTP